MALVSRVLLFITGSYLVKTVEEKVWEKFVTAKSSTILTLNCYPPSAIYTLKTIGQ